MSRCNRLLILSCFFIFLLSSSVCSSCTFSYGAYAKAPLSPSGPTVKDDNLTVKKIKDDNLTVKKITDGLENPTSMAFLGNDDILVTEKETGKVMRVLNGQILDEPVLDVPVANSIERGLLGIAISKQPDGQTYVFLIRNLEMMTMGRIS